MIKTVGNSLSKRSWQDRCLALGLSGAILTGTYLYNQGYQLAYECPILHFTGIPCPTCGMTRSLMAAMRGDWITSFNYHVFGPFLLLMLLGIMLYVPVELITKRSFLAIHSSTFLNRRFAASSLLILMGYHGTRLIHLCEQGLLIDNFIGSPLGRYLFTSLAGWKLNFPFS